MVKVGFSIMCTSHRQKIDNNIKAVNTQEKKMDFLIGLCTHLYALCICDVVSLTASRIMENIACRHNYERLVRWKLGSENVCEGYLGWVFWGKKALPLCAGPFPRLGAETAYKEKASWAPLLIFLPPDCGCHVASCLRLLLPCLLTTMGCNPDLIPYVNPYLCQDILAQQKEKKKKTMCLDGCIYLSACYSEHAYFSDIWNCVTFTNNSTKGHTRSLNTVEDLVDSGRIPFWPQYKPMESQ